MCATMKPKIDKEEGPEDTTKGPAPHQLPLVLLTSMLDMFALALVLPSYPKLCDSIGIVAKKRGLIISLYSLLQFFSSPLLGRASDRYGRANMLRLSAFTSVGCYLLMILAQTQLGFILARTLPGLLKCCITVSQAYVTDVSPPADRAKNFGMLGASFGLAFVVGPALGGLLMKYDLWLPTKVAVLVTMVNLTLLFTLREPVRHVHVSPDGPNKTATRGSEGQDEKKKGDVWTLIRRSPQGLKVLGLLSRKFALSLTTAVLETNLAQFLDVRLGVTGPLLGLVFSYLGLLSVLNNALLIRVVTQRVDEGALLLAASIALPLALLLFGYVWSMSTLLVVMALVSVASALLGSVTGAQLSSEIPPDLTGAVLGVSWAVETFSKIVAAPLGHFVIESYGAGWLGWAGATVFLPCLGHALLLQPVPSCFYARTEKEKDEPKVERKKRGPTRSEAKKSKKNKRGSPGKSHKKKMKRD